MAAYAVKHLVSEHGPLSRIMKDVKRTPHSFTSKEAEATGAALGCDVYVIEVRVARNERSYWLGYKYRAHEKYSQAGGSLWRGEFKFKNAARGGEPATGVYFDEPIRIEDSAVCQWLAAKQPGMSEIPEHLLGALDGHIQAADARPFS